MDIYKELSRVMPRGRPFSIEPPDKIMMRIKRLSTLVKKRSTLSEWLKEMAMSSADLGRVTGYSKQTISKIRRGIQQPSKDFLDKIYNISRGKVITVEDMTK